MLHDLHDIPAMRAALEMAADKLGSSRLDGKPGPSQAGVMAQHVFRFAQLAGLSEEERMTVLAYLACTRVEQDLDVIAWLEFEARAGHRLVPVVGFIDAH